MTANSSPPIRARVSVERRIEWARSAASMQDRVADRVAVAVVHSLEVVEVEDQQGEWAVVGVAAAAAGPGAGVELTVEGGVEDAAVADAGQRVAVGEVALAHLGGNEPLS